MTFENLQADNEIIAYINGKAIIQNEWGILFYLEIPEEYATIGEVVASTDLSSVEELPEQKQQEIISFIANI